MKREEKRKIREIVRLDVEGFREEGIIVNKRTLYQKRGPIGGKTLYIPEGLWYRLTDIIKENIYDTFKGWCYGITRDQFLEMTDYAERVLFENRYKR